jgi:hypothetical protein
VFVRCSRREHLYFKELQELEMTDKDCLNCHEPLLLEVEPDSDIEDTKATAVHESVPDDVELSCGCHFHWYGRNTSAIDHRLTLYC